MGTVPPITRERGIHGGFSATSISMMGPGREYEGGPLTYSPPCTVPLLVAMLITSMWRAPGGFRLQPYSICNIHTYIIYLGSFIYLLA